jgi:hypothetical protein
MAYGWNPLKDGRPRHSNRVVLKLEDSNYNVTYGIGYYSGDDWTMTCVEDGVARTIVAWSDLPE